ncbi:hypothetical protein [Mesobacterium pallidum]|uniref:hypothetical protein n=1 Tax=Mesobacterium pallidum TaxID=2872037 RepID=UPI001EE26C81|nr:hypothetical protein [Mesobacterium pallidum]
MLPFTRFHAATLLDLSAWSTLSRNSVATFIARFGIQPLGNKYPMLRIYEHLLGLSPSDAAEEQMLGGGLIRVTDVAERFGLSSDDLRDALRTPGNPYPPLYAFGPRRNLMLNAQVEQLLASPRNAFHSLAPIEGHALPASRLARHLKVPQARIDAILADTGDLPARIITHGRIRYIISDVAHRLASSEEKHASEEDLQAKETNVVMPDVAPSSMGGASRGLFADTMTRAAAQSETQLSCTASGANARRGDGLHVAPAEAKLSGT